MTRLLLFALALPLLTLSPPSGLRGQPQLAGPQESGPLAVAQVDFSDISKGDHVIIQRRGGGTIEGTVTEINNREVRVKTKYGSQAVPRDDIDSIAKKLSNDEEFEKRGKACKSADDWCDLAEWAKSVIEPDLATQAYEKAIELEPAHERAHKALGHIEYEGEWMPEEEAMRRQGKVRDGDRWVTPEEKAAREADERDELRKKKRRSVDERKREYEGRPWADVEPIETANYRVFCNSTDEVARNYARIMELLNKKYSKVFGKLPRYRSGKGNVYIHANNRQFYDWTGSQEGVGGFYKPWNGDVTAFHGTFGTTGSTYEVLAHEGTHQFEGFIMKNMWAAPMWIIEGFAVFFGDGSKLKRDDIEIGAIPYDRLLWLKRFMEDTSERAAWRCNTFMMRGQPYPGAYYATAWGVVYWCLWGNQVKNKAWNNGEGLRVMEGYLLRITKSDAERCDYVEELEAFKKLIVTETKYSTFEEWENSYREWVLGLELEELGKRKGSRWVSEGLGMEVGKPTGWRYIDPENLYSRYEVVAFEQSGSKARRISTLCVSNDNKDDLTIDLVKNISQGFFKPEPGSLPYEDLELEENLPAGISEVSDGYIAKVQHGHDTVEIIFTGIPITQANQNTSVGGGDGGDSDKAAENESARRFRVVFIASVDKIYAHVLEADPELYDGLDKTFETYLSKFKFL